MIEKIQLGGGCPIVCRLHYVAFHKPKLTCEMKFLINVNRLTHNFLKVELNGLPLTAAHPIWRYLYVMTQTPKFNISKQKTKLKMTYPVVLEEFHGYRSESLLNEIESYMFCKHVEMYILNELVALLEGSDDYNETFFQFQEHYMISDLDFSRDRMYKFYERYRNGSLKYKYAVDGLLVPESYLTNQL